MYSTPRVSVSGNSLNRPSCDNTGTLPRHRARRVLRGLKPEDHQQDDDSIHQLLNHPSRDSTGTLPRHRARRVLRGLKHVLYTPGERF